MITDHKTEYQVRLEKLKKIQDSGINPYPAKYDKQDPVKDIQDKPNNIQLKTAGRLMSIREMGKIIFCHLQDDSTKAQIALKQDEVGEDQFKFFQKNIDVADFVGVEGEIFTTQKGEKTLLVKKYQLLSKALLPLPEKWHGIKDEEERLRKKYLDILINPETKDIFIKKANYDKSIREFLNKKGFIEVATPVLETTTGGADARPFITHHNALDIDVYLRISVGELWQKRLMVASFEKTFEMGRIFRNEGMSPEHLQDYTSMEFYWAYADWNDSMELVEELVKYIAKQTFNTLKFKIRDFNLDLSKKWTTYDYRQTILEHTQVDIEQTSVKDIKNKLQELKVDYDDFNNLERGIDQLMKYCRKKLTGPGWLIYPPKFISPLAKESTERPGYVERYWLILAGSELCNGYTELNDPIDQEERFQKQAALREAGDKEAQMHDKEFVEALKHGMPPTTGLGISERLFSFLIDKPIRECQIFPLMKPKDQQSNKQTNGNKNLSFKIDPRIFEKYPDLNIGVVVAKGIDNRGEDQEIINLIREQEKNIQQNFDRETLSQNPKIDAWRKAYSIFGAKPKEYKCSVENLYRMVLSDKPIRHINKIVDIYNYISLKHLVPVGGDDINKVDGQIKLTLAESNEKFIQLNSTETKNPKPGEVIYMDDKEVLCRRWNWRECDKSKMTEDTQNVTIVVEGLPPTDKDDIEKIIHELGETVQKYCGSQIEYHILNKNNPQININNTGSQSVETRFIASQNGGQTEDLGLNLTQAQQLVDQHITDEKTKFHLLESEAIMRALAKHFGEDEEKWGIVGLLHDIDWDLTKDDTSQHCVKAIELLKQAGASEFLIETIISHAYGHSGCGGYEDKQRTTRIQHALIAAETVTGLIFASALMQPDKKLSSVKLSSLKKKFKDKRFAANCNREIILECEKIGLSLEEFLSISLKAMQEIAGEIGL